MPWHQMLFERGGCYIKYPDIKESEADLFDDDNVHLSQAGNENIAK